MTRRKSNMDILRNEKYMDDAVSSAFLNLHKAAKRKTEYIWANKGFSLDCIYNNPTELETCNKNKNPNHHDLKSDCEINKMNLKDQKQLLLPNSAQKKDRKKTVYFKSESKYSDLINGKLLSNVKISDLTRSSQILKANKLCESGVKQDVGSRISAENQNFPDSNPIKTENGDKSSFEIEQTSCDLKINVPAYDVPLEKNVNSSNHETEIVSNYEKSKLICPNIKQNELKENGEKHLSCSANSFFPEQKRVENEICTNENLDCEKERGLKTVLSLKILKGDKVVDFKLELEEFERILKRFPKLKEVFPEVDKEEKEVEFSADAVKVVFGFLCSSRYPAPDERTSVEVLAAFKSWEIDQFHIKFQDELIANLNEKNVGEAYRAAVHYGLGKLCNVFKRFSDLPCDTVHVKRRYITRKCHISISKYVEPLEFHIPLKILTPTHHNNTFNRNIRNEILFKVIKGTYIITGFNILLNLDKRNTDLGYLDIAYTVRNKQNYRDKQDREVKKPFRSNIEINLIKNIEVDADETVEIAVDITVKPYLCSANEESIIEMSSEGFSVSIKSNFKVPNSNERRFFIEKLLYYPKT